MTLRWPQDPQLVALHQYRSSPPKARAQPLKMHAASCNERLPFSCEDQPNREQSRTKHLNALCGSRAALAQMFDALVRPAFSPIVWSCQAFSQDTYVTAANISSALLYIIPASSQTWHAKQGPLYAAKRAPDVSSVAIVRGSLQSKYTAYREGTAAITPNRPPHHPGNPAKR